LNNLSIDFNLISINWLLEALVPVFFVPGN
jgi:hypothetical protein